jgi:hypothetical protein
MADLQQLIGFCGAHFGQQPHFARIHEFSGILSYRVFPVSFIYSAYLNVPCGANPNVNYFASLIIFLPKLSDFPSAIIVYAGQFSGGDKTRPYLFGETSFVVAGFIPACKGQPATSSAESNVEKIIQFRYIKLLRSDTDAIWFGMIPSEFNFELILISPVIGV